MNRSSVTKTVDGKIPPPRQFITFSMINMVLMLLFTTFMEKVHSGINVITTVSWKV